MLLVLLQAEAQSTVLNCGYSRHSRGGGGTLASAHEAARSALQLIADLNGRALRSGHGQPGDLLCVFGFAAQCVAFDRAAAARFLQQSRSRGGPAPDELDALVRRLRNLLTHRRAQKMGEVLVYGKSAQKQLFEALPRHNKALVSHPLPYGIISIESPRTETVLAARARHVARRTACMTHG